MYGVEKKRATVLVADDEECLRNMVKAYLEQCGHEVLAAGNSAEALRIARTFEGTIRLLLTDMRMPGMGGEALAEAFRAQHPEAHVVCMTADPLSEARKRLPGTRFLPKPFDLDELSEVVRASLACGV